MLAGRRLTLAGLVLVGLLSACQPGGGDDIVGRWEFGDQEFGIAYEFNGDGTGVIYNSLDPFYPTPGTFTYTYDEESGVLKARTEAGPGERTIIYLITFETKDDIVVEQSGMNKALPFVRKPLPDLPPGARARIGFVLLGQPGVLVEAEELGPGWDKEFGDYIMVARTDLEMTVGEDLEEWLVKLQVEGEEQNRVYVLSKGEGSWGVMELVAKG